MSSSSSCKHQKKLVFLTFTQNNYIITLTTLKGNVIIFESAGTCDFVGAKKKSSFCIREIIFQFLEKIKRKYELLTIEIYIKGIGLALGSALKLLSESFLYILKIIFRNSIAHNGCRLPKKRRL